MLRRFPQARRQPVPFECEHHDEQRRDHKTWNADREQRDKACDIIPRAPAADRTVKSKRYPNALRKEEGANPQRHRHRQTLLDNVVHGMVAILHRRAKIAARKIAEVTEVLFPQWFIEVVFGFERPLDFRRSRFAFLIKRTSWRDANENEGKEA